jgi:hypothetical protein
VHFGTPNAYSIWDPNMHYKLWLPWICSLRAWRWLKTENWLPSQPWHRSAAVSVHCTKSCIYSQKVLLRRVEFFARNMKGWIKKINIRQSCWFLLVIYIVLLNWWTVTQTSKFGGLVLKLLGPGMSSVAGYFERSVKVSISIKYGEIDYINKYRFVRKDSAKWI